MFFRLVQRADRLPKERKNGVVDAPLNTSCAPEVRARKPIREEATRSNPRDGFGT